MATVIHLQPYVLHHLIEEGSGTNTIMIDAQTGTVFDTGGFFFDTWGDQKTALSPKNFF